MILAVILLTWLAHANGWNVPTALWVTEGIVMWAVIVVSIGRLGNEIRFRKEMETLFDEREEEEEDE